ncbi:nucleoside deaminase [Deminuibacter soli]|uniref:Nucleoside deaminase n=1 Tax=Deminuibacter soli TaxID=2291815 RepID=A0A3E1NJT3_9BACT|nr:nucleoside deaminase [Deminuibacter soli]RFM28048.1 nucleoside deaminase [Deminuibacter soli]
MNANMHKRFMQMAIDLSQFAIDSKTGGPFGAIIVKQDKIVGCSSNGVFLHNDPTAHAEMLAIRNACSNLKTIDLSGCVIYSSAEPCPMCTAAIYWSKIDRIYYANSEEESLKYGFYDKEILEELRKPKSRRTIKSQRIVNAKALEIFERALKSY